ncbi:hypothetical protein MNBD_GAMMA02-294 [hydrothermal vent metagenome]|uniref:Transposase DDE domain-containing protein n=1 Tax=hydrothermal vent metagenome TaxID=652676 RepID=A0A3B0W316_9ZZZZ
MMIVAFKQPLKWYCPNPDIEKSIQAKKPWCIMVLLQNKNHPTGETKIYEHITTQLSNYHELLTSRGGLLAIATLMQKLNLANLIDKYFVQPKSNRGFNPSVFVNSSILMQHEGGIRLDDLEHLKKDKAITKLLGLKNIPQPDSVGDWLRRMATSGVNAISLINKELCRIALKDIKHITLDIDASEIISNKKEAKKTYKFNHGYMPMVGHIAEINHVIETDFRAGNTAPKAKNLEFIKKCEDNLPDGVKLKNLRIDCAGYQKSIIQYCDECHIKTQFASNGRSLRNNC